jgi:hypothetical protein
MDVSEQPPQQLVGSLIVSQPLLTDDLSHVATLTSNPNAEGTSECLSQNVSILRERLRSIRVFPL